MGSMAIRCARVFKIRSRLMRLPETPCLSITRRRMTRQGFWKIVKKYAKDANIRQDITPTHAAIFATHLLENGADLRSVQECWGMPTFPPLDLYPLTRGRLKEVYAKAHPRA